MDFYGKSGYAQRCIYADHGQIVALRRAAHQRAAERIQEYLSFDEEARLQRHYRSLVDMVCGHLRYPRLVADIAHWLLLRFYLVHALLDHDPKHVMLAAILVASKVGNLHLTPDAFSKAIPNCQVDLLVSLELVVMEAAAFELAYHCPQTALHGWLTLALASASDAAADDQSLVNAREELRLVVRSDAILLHHPSHLALAVAVKHLPTCPILREYWERFRGDNIIFQPIINDQKDDQASLKEIDRRLIKMRQSL